MSNLSEELKAEGRAEGRAEGQLKIMADLFKFGKMTLEEISQMWGVSAAEIQNYINNSSPRA